MREAVGDSPSEEQIEQYLKDTMAKGLVIPGYGHAVLRVTDPRFTCQMEFAKRYMPNDVLCKLVGSLYKVAPRVLQATGKVSNPFPNVDAHSGALLTHFGMTEYDYYTVLFGVSRAIGCTASLVWSRALGLPLERPESVTLDKLEEYVKKS
jgi:citrate synthase